MPEYEKLTPGLIARVVGQGGLHTRLSIARQLNRSKTTYLNSIIDRGAKEGLYYRVWMEDTIGGFWAYTASEPYQEEF